MQQAETHTVDGHIVHQKNEISREFLDSVLDDLGDRPDLPPTIFRYGVRMAAGLAVSPERADQAPAELRLGARCAALMFVHAWQGNDKTFIALDDERDVELHGAIDASFVHAPAWIDAMWCAVACGDQLAQEWLASVPPSRLQPAGVQHGRYALPMAEFLRSLVTRDGRHGQWLTRAIEAADDDSDPVLQETRDHVDALHHPALRAAFHLLAEDQAGFEQALADLHEQHKRYWSRDDNRLAVDGLLSLPGCALLRLAAEWKRKVQFASGYMPPVVWQAPVVRQPDRCPYCVAPLSPRARMCGPCGREITDAPLELTATAIALSRRPCNGCGTPLHLLAVVCPQCRAVRD